MVYYAKRGVKRARSSGSAKPAPRRTAPQGALMPKHVFRRSCRKINTYYNAGWVDSATNLLQSTLTGGGGIFRFTLAELPNYNEFLNLYEQIRIKSIKLRFLPVIGNSAEVATSTRAVPFAVAVDTSALDLANAAPSIADLTEQDGVRIYNGQYPFTVTINNPKSYFQIDGQAGPGAYGGWMNTTNSGALNVQHFGCKFAWETTSASAYSAYSVYATYTIECKNPK